MIWNTFVAVIKKESLLARRHSSELLAPVIYFLMITSLFPLGLRLDNALLKQIAPAILWVAALLATLQVIERLFKTDFEDGSLEQLFISPTSVSFILWCKICAHWALTAIPLVIVSPLLALLLLFPPDMISRLVLLLFVGTPALSFIGAMGVALTLGLRRAGLLISIITLPLYIPLLILGAQATVSLLGGHTISPYLLLFLAADLLAMLICPLVTALALRIMIS